MRNAWPFALLSVAMISIGSATARAQAVTPDNQPPQPAVADETVSRPPEPCAGPDNVDGSQTNCTSDGSAANSALVKPNDGGTEPTVSVGVIDQTNFPLAICIALGREAMANDLPVEFFTRLIWQESRFNSQARSHVGAEGIAQFMPGTARWRGLADAYDPFQALRESAKWLAELQKQFGNRGLAAAAYNAGPGRIERWLAGHTFLPLETRHYVRIVTGHSAEEWSQHDIIESGRPLPVIPCNAIAKLIARSSERTRVAMPSAQAPRSGTQVPRSAAWGPWGLQLAGDWSEARALDEYRKLQQRFPTILGDRDPLVLKSRGIGRGSATWYRIRVAESTQDRAKSLCNKLEAAGGRCIVLPN
jgi:hypothetical protein